ncbi:hypothetical protein ACIHCQ_01330 [Streptomyces sp. NPDC052236]|uniref:hypothetical protein n=1 Tax=Streptomyces sp. NPDC052236 TaxID=3365686 RepID=UPI0037D3DAB0
MTIAAARLRRELRNHCGARASALMASCHSAHSVCLEYSHTATVPAGTELVLIAGQYGSGPDGAVVSTDFTEQVKQTFRDIGVALAAVH